MLAAKHKSAICTEENMQLQTPPTKFSHLVLPVFPIQGPCRAVRVHLVGCISLVQHVVTDHFDSACTQQRRQACQELVLHATDLCTNQNGQNSSKLREATYHVTAAGFVTQHCKGSTCEAVERVVLNNAASEMAVHQGADR